MTMKGTAVTTVAVFMVSSGAFEKIIAMGTKVSITHQNKRAFGEGSCPSSRPRVQVADTA